MQYETLLVDGPYLAHKSYDAPYKLTTSDGRDVTMIHSFMRSLYSVYKRFVPDQTIIGWESHGTPSWRRSMYPAYKPGSGFDPQFVIQVKDLQILLYLLNIPQFNASRNEADDVIATLSKTSTNIIFTVDKDLMQLVTPTTHLFNDKDKKVYTESLVEERFLVPPTRIPDLLAIMGDKADNITGLSGYGPKKSAKAVSRINLIETIPSNDELYTHHQKLLLNKRLTQLNKNCTLLPIIEDTTESIESILAKYELKKMLQVIPQYKKMSKRESILDYL